MLHQLVIDPAIDPIICNWLVVWSAYFFRILGIIIPHDYFFRRGWHHQAANVSFVTTTCQLVSSQPSTVWSKYVGRKDIYPGGKKTWWPRPDKNKPWNHANSWEFMGIGFGASYPQMAASFRWMWITKLCLVNIWLINMVVVQWVIYA